MPTELDLALRLLLAAGLAAAIGAEREFSDQSVGFRTHILVGAGSALFAIVSAFGFQAIVEASGDVMSRIDPSRVAAQIVVGVGFLGGGAIIKSGSSVRGITTAAGLWVTAAVGTACGIGMLAMAIATTLISILALALLKPLLKPIRANVKSRKKPSGELIVLADSDVELGGVLNAFRDADLSLKGLNVQQDGTATVIRADVGQDDLSDSGELLVRLQGHPHVREVAWHA